MLFADGFLLVSPLCVYWSAFGLSGSAAGAGVAGAGCCAGPFDGFGVGDGVAVGV